MTYTHSDCALISRIRHEDKNVRGLKPVRQTRPLRRGVERWVSSGRWCSQMPVPINALEKWHQHQHWRWLIDERGGRVGSGEGVRGGYPVYKEEDLPHTKDWPTTLTSCHAGTFSTKSSTVCLDFPADTEGKQGKDGVAGRPQRCSWRQVHFLTIICLVSFQWRCFPWVTLRLWPWYSSSAVYTARLNHWGKRCSRSPLNSLMIVSVLQFTVVVVVSAGKEPSVRFSSCITFGNTNKLENDRTGFRRSWRTLLSSAPNLSTRTREISKVFSPTMSWGQTCGKPECK